MRRALALALALLAGCTAPDGSGAGARMRVEGGQFFQGAMPADTTGPKVTSVVLSTNFMAPGQIGKPLRGTVEPNATSAAIGLSGDEGYWVVPVGLPDVQEPGLPTYGVKLSFAPDLPIEDYQLTVRAGDASGELGPESNQPLTATAAPTLDAPLVITLSWDTEADLDLHVVDPAGVEIWKRDINSYVPPPPGKKGDPADIDRGGLLDFDSNAACVIDGRRRESVIWKLERPAGHYIARVDTFSLCGEPAARWTVEALAGGALVARAHGTSTDSDTRMPHDRGAGVTAIEFDLP